MYCIIFGIMYDVLYTNDGLIDIKYVLLTFQYIIYNVKASILYIIQFQSDCLNISVFISGSD
jgi:hypothetical protein